MVTLLKLGHGQQLFTNNQYILAMPTLHNAGHGHLCVLIFVRTAFTRTQERLSPWQLSIMRISFVSFVHLDRFHSFCCSIIFVVVSFVSVVVPLVCRSYLCPFVLF